MKKGLFLFAIIALCIPGWGQEFDLLIDTFAVGHRFLNSYEMELQMLPTPSSQSANCHGWHVGVDVTTFMRDAEFSLPNTRGYTALGYFVQPYASRRINRFADLTLGVNLAGAAGYDGLHSWRPVVSFNYCPSDHLRIVMGTINGGLAHGLYEPMYDRERWIYDHQEEGLQIRWSGKSLLSDIWINWEDLLEPWQTKQERFTMGTSNVLTLYQSRPESTAASRFDISLPFSFLGSHRGGQFTSLDTCIQSLFTESVALRFTLRRVSSLSLDLPIFFYQDISPTKCMAFDNGWGVWPQISYSVPIHITTRKNGEQLYFPAMPMRLILQAGYWYGHQFIAPRGSYLFQSISWHKPSYVVADRQMVTARIAFDWQHGAQFHVGLDSEFYYDVQESGLDIAFGLYMRYIL